MLILRVMAGFLIVYYGYCIYYAIKTRRAIRDKTFYTEILLIGDELMTQVFDMILKVSKGAFVQTLILSTLYVGYFGWMILGKDYTRYTTNFEKIFGAVSNALLLVVAVLPFISNIKSGRDSEEVFDYMKKYCYENSYEEFYERIQKSRKLQKSMSIYSSSIYLSYTIAITMVYMFRMFLL